MFVIFGATGDLASRKLVPAIFSLKMQGMLPDRFVLVGIGRTEYNTEDFREKMKDSILNFSEEKVMDDADFRGFLERIEYFRLNYTSTSDYEELRRYLSDICNKCGIAANMIFYMATPPGIFETISLNLSRAGLAGQEGVFRRFIIEKPFGRDLESARRLNRILHGIISEDQIFRIDHYLGKETVQNLMVTRFANGIFEPLWNRNYIHRVEITSAESIGIENRGSYYDSTGALRDMLQNHLLQMAGLTAMEPPSSLDPESIRYEVLKVFQSLQPIREENVKKQVVRGQYTASMIRGESIKGYRQEKDVDRNSGTETFVAMKFFINNWRWGGVPFYIRTGKRLPARVAEVVIHFKATPHHLFQHNGGKYAGNQLIVRIQPDEGILLKFDMKEPGSGFSVKNVEMDFHYRDLADVRVPSAYERLLYDVMTGDLTLFSRDDEIETAWKFLAPVLNAWESDPSIKMYGYPADTWGPLQSDNLIEGDGLSWRYPCKNMADEEKYCEL